MQLIVDREAEVELDAAMTWYNERRQGLGLELHAEVQIVLETIGRSPSQGWKYGEDGYRVLPVNRFPYLVYYLEADDHIWVAAIAHQRRRPSRR